MSSNLPSEHRKPGRPDRTRLLPASAVNGEPGTPLRGSLSLPTHRASWGMTGLVVHRLRPCSLDFPESNVLRHYNSQRAPRRPEPRLQRLGCQIRLPRGLFGGSSLFLVLVLLRPVLLWNHPTDSKGSLQGLDPSACVRKRPTLQASQRRQ